jgi:hypothetical protein
MWSVLRWSLAAAVTLVFTVPASAQQRTPGEGGLFFLTSSMRAQAPTLPSDEPTTAIHLAVAGTATALLALPAAMQRQSQNVAMMIVGGAGLVVGSVIEGDTGTIIMAGGGILALVGLFRYLH